MGAGSGFRDGAERERRSTRPAGLGTGSPSRAERGRRAWERGARPKGFPESGVAVEPVAGGGGWQRVRAPGGPGALGSGRPAPS